MIIVTHGLTKIRQERIFGYLKGCILKLCLRKRSSFSFSYNPKVAFKTLEKICFSQRVAILPLVVTSTTVVGGVAEWLRRSVSNLVRSTCVGSNPIVGITNHKQTVNSAVHPYEVG